MICHSMEAVFSMEAMERCPSNHRAVDKGRNELWFVQINELCDTKNLKERKIAVN